MSRNRRGVFIFVTVAAMLCGLAALAWGDVYLSTYAGVKGPFTGFTNADLNGTYRFRNLEFQDFGDTDRTTLVGSGSVTFNGAGAWTGSIQNLDSNGSVDTETLSGTYTMDPSGSFTFTLTGGTTGHIWNGHIAKDAGRNFMVLTLGAELGSFVIQSLVVAVKERATTPSLSALNGTYAYRILGVYDFESQDPDATVTIADVTCDGAGNWTAPHTSYNADGKSETGTVAGTYAVNGKSFDFTVTGETGVFLTADLSSDGNTLVTSSTTSGLAQGEQIIGTMVKKNPAVTFSNASLSGSYKIGGMQLEDFVGTDPEAYVIEVTSSFNGAGGFTSSYSTFSDTGTLTAGTSSGVYAVSADGSFTLTITSLIPNENFTGTISADGHVVTLTRVDGIFSAPGELFLDMGLLGLYTFDGYDLKLLTTDPQGMAGVDGGIAIGFPGYGLYAYDGSDWETLSAAVPDEMIFWTDALVVDFGIYGVWAYNGSTWLSMTPANPQGMAVWGDNIAIYFPGYGVWSFNGSSWSQVTPASVEQLVGWGSQLVVDFGNVWGVYVYNAATPTRLDPASPEDMIVWGNKLVMDYSNLGQGVWSYDGSTWTDLAVGNPEAMLGWGDYLVLDYGASGVFLYDLTRWTPITTMNPEDMAIAEFD